MKSYNFPWNNIKKSNIAIATLEKFDSATKTISHSSCNNILYIIFYNYNQTSFPALFIRKSGYSF